MNAGTVPSEAGAFAFELRFEPLFQPGRALAFPCDGEGHVDLERCSREERTSYLFARAMVGREYKGPRVVLTPPATAAPAPAPPPAHRPPSPATRR